MLCGGMAVLSLELTMSLFPLRFAIAELRHERLFAAGVVLAVCSVLTPVLLLLGVKNGMIDSLRGKLMNNPQIREVRLNETVDVEPTWVAEMAQDPLVAFVVPSVRQISLYGRVRRPDSADWTDAEEILPSASGDPVTNVAEMDWPSLELPIPCMVSDGLAEALGATVGNDVLLEQTRSEAGRPQAAEVKLRIFAIVPRSSSPTKALYLPVRAIESIEDYKDGKVVNLFGWKGVATESISCFHGLAVQPEEPGEAGVVGLTNDLISAFPGAAVTVFDVRAIQELLGAPLETQGEVIVVQYDKPELDLHTWMQFQKTHPEFKARVIPFLAPMDGKIGSSANTPRRATIRTRSPRWFQPKELFPLFEAPPTVKPDQETTWIEVGSGSEARSRFQVAVGKVGELVVDLPPQFAGLVGSGLSRPVLYSQATGDFRTQRLNYSGFRLYARSIDDVMALRQKVENAGFNVRTEEDRILDVRKLDNGLSKLFMLVAGMAAVGGVGALSASLYLSIERAKRQLCVMQILGASKLMISVSIVLQSLILVAMGSSLALWLYYVGARILQHLFGDAVGDGEVLCKLPFGQAVSILITTSCIGALVGVLASFRLRGLDPAAIARSE
jgi:putative ABC transport system permease protein